MRLSKQEIAFINQLGKLHFGDDAAIYLFGSRVDDSKKGGDIDLYIETSLSADKAFKAKIKFLTDLELQIGEQKIDVVIKNNDREPQLIHKVAKETGVRLC